MRIISGTHRGRNINPPAGLPVRPTTDFAKEGLFNVLQHQLDFEEIEVLDLFCGTGNISFEFASRGAKQIMAVDSGFKCTAFVKKQAEEFKFNQIKVINTDVFQLLKKLPSKFDVIFADPPFAMEKIEQLIELVFQNQLLKEDGIFILEHEGTHNFAFNKYLKEKRTYGKITFSIFANI